MVFLYAEITDAAKKFGIRRPSGSHWAQVNSGSITMLHRASEMALTEVVKLFLDKGVDVNIQTSYVETPDRILYMMTQR